MSSVPIDTSSPSSPIGKKPAHRRDDQARHGSRGSAEGAADRRAVGRGELDLALAPEGVTCEMANPAEIA
jgi:hypothetical protein